MKLHIGCGPKYLKGYKHIDVIESPHIDFVCDAANLSAIDDNDASEIYACHILEHIKKHDVSTVLDEWSRVLKPGGLLRIAVPDFESIVQEYASSNDAAKLQGLLYGGQTYAHNFHYAAYDFKLLSQILEDADFHSIERYDWRDFLPDQYDDFSRAYMPHMDFESGRLMSLNVTAINKA